ncbi:T9SS type A sorting domain-containing protein [Pseudobacter ginsenosidimutans]|uniref:Putative secreted protein (Por secretion system target) n=1 Tax=Pseudobacter ginsenosidimutans TaxID=661488 RepID=A0A4Q7N3W8_9BACT|nr:T9SS type A sorting domain-containing protein [Pseudobacter ginsenosidimutans]QEC44218.1 T9SS type A sorting domain-containing protein [Pseudobacter ginsenosidimutans]RZS75676.1 putative secreted protein (Por secretion system target) [Pseudobacter ginsenosidimutans]
MSNLYKTLTRIACNLIVPVCLSTTAYSATFIVNSNASSGAGSLAQAIIDANTNPGADIIRFNLPAGSLVISLTSPLPAITGELSIEGYSQPGAAQGSISARTILVQVDGNAMGGSNNIFTIASQNVSISGLAISRATRSGIFVQQGANNAFIWGNFIGTDATGLVANGNTGAGVAVDLNGALSGPGTTGVVVGTNGDNTNDANEGNLISAATGNSEGDGVIFWNTQNSIIAGNYIGVTRNGTAGSFGNARNGILLTVSANNNVVGTNGNGVSDALEGNIIGNNTGRGILNWLSNGNVIAGNRVGLDINNAAAPNAEQGILLVNCQNNRVGTNGSGGNAAVEANLIGFNISDGVRIANDNFLNYGLGNTDNTTGNIVAGNGIGTDLAGTLDAGNQGSGVRLLHDGDFASLSLSGNIIGSNNDGSEDAAEGNRIANNNSGGIVVDAAASLTVLDNKFSRNRIFSNNGQLGIDLGANLVTSNDDGDTDNGPNTLLNFPVITSVTVNGGNLTIQGFSRPNSVIEFYIADAGPNPNPLPGGYTTDFGEGQTYLFRGQDDATLDAPDAQSGTSGTYTATQEGTGTGSDRTEARFSFTIPVASLPAAVTAGTRITALAYMNASGAGNTSEFGPVSSIVATPVRLLSLDATLNNGKVYIRWKTAEEINNDHFEILKATDGSQYNSIATIAAKGSNSSYQFIDNNPERVNMYKLRQVDIDGRTTDSKILVVRADQNTITLKAAPNPFGSYINLSYKLDREESIRVKLYSFSGALVRTYNIKGNAGVNTTSFTDLGNLPAGNYTLELTGSSISLKQQVIKQ